MGRPAFAELGGADCEMPLTPTAAQELLMLFLFFPATAMVALRASQKLPVVASIHCTQR